eukprot:GAHX01002133.1.p1 GENE.GAHX01002133.1~~GAHX01002133.1.p1  ORF type:complete len:195 (+),score=42.70 GAHX01002133.1:41-625(+)
MEIKNAIEDKIRLITGKAYAYNVFNLSCGILDNTEGIRLKKLFNFGYFLGALNNTHLNQEEYLQTLKYIADNYLENNNIMGKFYGFLGIGSSNVELVDGMFKNNIIVNFDLSGKEVYLGIYEILKLTINQLIFQTENLSAENGNIDDNIIEETMKFIESRILNTLAFYINDCLRIEVDKFKYGNMDVEFENNQL